MSKLIVATLSFVALLAAFLFIAPAPSAPSLQSQLTCVSRDTMISRAQVWVDKKVPYSQSGSYDGYRTDCSGYVSMAWQLSKPGLVTSTFHTVASNITKDSLTRGDAILCDSEHIVLFDGWTDSGKTHYVAMEETRPGEGTVKRVTPYPYWSNVGCFHPIRYHGVC